MPTPTFAITLQDINDTLQGGAFFILTGQNFEETHIGVVGGGEISGKVRLTYTNGILNTAEDCVQSRRGHFRVPRTRQCALSL